MDGATGSEGPQAGAAATWTLTQVTPAERLLLRRLFELYLYDFSEMEHADLDDEGWFVPHAAWWLERYWSEPGKEALLLRAGSKPAGFVLLDERSPIAGSADRRSIAAFFVARAYRRRGLGEAMAREVFRRFPGRWQVLEVKANPRAQAFWRRIIAEVSGGVYTERWVSEREVVQEFETTGGGG
ncbi:MAG: GNAT family N-acetyltransferase [Chloroflexia bacterium]|nr:GNAT family N-acetyltransferase [Chloroflexia bacterium]